MFQAAAEWPDLQSAVATLCMGWWQAGAAGKEAIVAQTLPYFLVRALSTSAPILVWLAAVPSHPTLVMQEQLQKSIQRIRKILL